MSALFLRYKYLLPINMCMYNVDNWQELYTDHKASKHNVVGLPNKYDVDLNKLDQGIAVALSKFTMTQYTVNEIPVPGYFGLCFKSTSGSHNPLSEGLSSNVYSHGNINKPIDAIFTQKTDAWFPYLDEIVNKFNGQVTQIRLIKLESGHNLLSRTEKLHIDYPWYRGIRIHICLTPDVDYVWRVLDDDYHLKRSSKMFYLDTGKPHGAVNFHNNKDRYVLNFNLIPRLDNHIDYQIENSII